MIRHPWWTLKMQLKSWWEGKKRDRAYEHLRKANKLGYPPTPIGFATRDIKCGELLRAGDIMVEGHVMTWHKPR